MGVTVSMGASVHGCKHPCVQEHPCVLERSSREGIGQQGGPGTAAGCRTGPSPHPHVQRVAGWRGT